MFLNKVRHSTRQSVNKDMNQLIIINALSDILVNIKPKCSDNILLNILPAIRYHHEPFQLWLFCKIAIVIGIIREHDKLFSFLLYLFFCNCLHILQLFITQNDKCNRLNSLIPHKNVSGLLVIDYLYFLVEVSFETDLHLAGLLVSEVSRQADDNCIAGQEGYFFGKHSVLAYPGNLLIVVNVYFAL